MICFQELNIISGIPGPNMPAVGNLDLNDYLKFPKIYSKQDRKHDRTTVNCFGRCPSAGVRLCSDNVWATSSRLHTESVFTSLLICAVKH